MSATRVERVAAILRREYPYRFRDKQIRRIANVLPTTRSHFRAAQDWFIAAAVALPFRLRPTR